MITMGEIPSQYLYYNNTQANYPFQIQPDVSNHDK